MKKRIISFMMSMIMFLCILTISCGVRTSQADAADFTEKTKYVAFGDSIAAGYGLDGYAPEQTTVPQDSYQSLVAGFLKTDSCNYAVTGDDSDACIRLLDSGAADADLADADIISLSIGSNDLLLPFIQILLNYFDIDPSAINPDDFANGITMPQLTPSEMLSYYKQVQTLTGELADHELLHTKARDFGGKLSAILATLRQKAPEAEIYVTNIYNPFYFVPFLKDISQQYIDEINQAFTADSPDYTLADVNTLFRQEELTNVRLDISDLSSLNVDPHPSIEGHKVIAECIIQALKETHAPKPAALRSLSSTRKYRLTADIRLPAGADGCEIRYASSKTGTYKLLGKTSDRSFQTNSGKLKPGKTYYVKIRSFRTMKGVTYYGKFSGAKKIKIRPAASDAA